MNGPLAAVTGATGFLGRRLVEDLGRRGWRVRALVRREPEAGLWGETAPQIVRGDLDDEAALASLARGADVVVHVAGLIKARDRAAFMAVNADGAGRVATAAKAANARLLMISSQAAREPQLSDYAFSKAAGERAAVAAGGEGVTILRPPAIYGPGDRETFALFRLAARSSVLPLPGDPRARVALAHVDDVCAVAALLAQQTIPGTWTVGGARPEGYAWREIFETAGTVLGRRPSLLPIAPWLLRTAGAVSERVGRATGDPAIFTSGKARELLHRDWSVSPKEEAPGAPPAQFDLVAGFAHSVAWYRRVGWLTQ